MIIVPHHPFVVYLHSSTVQLRCDSPIAVSATILQGNLFNSRSAQDTTKIV
jgi:hypothetical protein